MNLRTEPTGHVFKDWVDEGVRCLVVQGPHSVNAYVGIPTTHPLANHSYDDIPVDVHGGFTYSQEGDGYFPVGYWWYGWDYAHAGDESTSDDPQTAEIMRCVSGHLWTADEVVSEVYGMLYEFHQLQRLAERIATKPLFGHD